MIIPTGISNSHIVLEIRSATSMKEIPTEIDAGRSSAGCEPNINLVICGEIKQTQPITPQIDTIAAVPIQANRMQINRSLFTDIPRLLASSSPIESAKRRHLMIKRAAMEITDRGRPLIDVIPADGVQPSCHPCNYCLGFFRFNNYLHEG